MLLSKLSAFVTVASQRHFAKAAAQLRMSPSALSQTIKSIEESLGVRLLNRTTRLATRTGTISAFGAQPKGFSPGTVAPARMPSVPQP